MLSDVFDIGELASEATHAFAEDLPSRRLLKDAAYDGHERDYQQDRLRDDGWALRGAVRWRAAINAANRGVRVRARLHQGGNGVQCRSMEACA